MDGAHAEDSAEEQGVEAGEGGAAEHFSIPAQLAQSYLEVKRNRLHQFYLPVPFFSYYDLMLDTMACTKLLGSRSKVIRACSK